MAHSPVNGVFAKMTMKNCHDSDLVLAFKLQARECGVEDIDEEHWNNVPEAAFANMYTAAFGDGVGGGASKSNDGTDDGSETEVMNPMERALEFVEDIVKLNEELHTKKQDLQVRKSPRLNRSKTTSPSQQKEMSDQHVDAIQMIEMNDMVALAERMFVAQNTFAQKGKPTTVDIGYHSTPNDNLAKIEADGLLSKPERELKGIQTNYNGSSLGEGIYTINDVTNCGNYGNLRLMVARLKGQTMDSTAAQKGYKNGNNSLTNGNVIVLQHRFQCLVLFRFPENLVRSAEGCRMVRDLETKVSKLLDKHFHGTPKRKKKVCAKRPHASSASSPSAVATSRRSQHATDRPKNRRKALRQDSTIKVAPLATTRTHNYKAPKTIKKAAPVSSLYAPVIQILDDDDVADKKPSPISRTDNDECAICLCSKSENPKKIVVLKACGHEFHKDCIDQFLRVSRKCPICRTLLDEPCGVMPSGTMTVSVDKNETCSGFPKGSIIIQYNIPGGIQKDYHENPGQAHGSANRVAYLPNTTEGQKLLSRLEYCFMHGLTFTVGTSLTSGQANSVTWSSVHHKTSLSGGVHGFPDPTYFVNCNSELDTVGVPQADM